MRAILTYHSIDSSGSPISIDGGTFRSHVEWIVRSRIPVVDVEALLSLPASATAVALTFDDAFASFASHAWPMLREHDLPVTLFVATDHVGGTNAWDAANASMPTFPVLGWSELGRLQEEGVTLGAHTRTHPDLRLVSDARLEDELSHAAAQLQVETGRRPTAFAYPFGAFDARALAAVRTAYRVACTTDFRVIRTMEDPHCLPRLDAFYFRDPQHLEAWGSTRFRRRVWMRARARDARRTLTRMGVL